MASGNYMDIFEKAGDGLEENKEEQEGQDICGNYGAEACNNIHEQFCMGFTSRCIRYPQYKSCDKRIWTFDGMQFESTELSLEKLAEAGFFHTDEKDILCCFYCGVRVQNWEDKDCPYDEHLYWSPFCDYMEMIKVSKWSITNFYKHMNEKKYI